MAVEPRPSPLAQRGVTRREAEVLGALAERLTNAEIAERLYLSERTVESHVSSLLRKLGAGNRVELGDVAKDVLAGVATTRPAPLPAPLALLADAGPFVGRREELDLLRRTWQRAVEGRLLVGVVTGEAGVGKSRLVAELAAEVYGAGASVAQGSCFEDLRLPYEPFVQVISTDVATLSGAEVRRRVAGSAEPLAWLVPELRSPGSVDPAQAVVDPASAQAQVFESLRGYLIRAAAAGPLLLVVEDVHWATSSTLGVLRHLARLGGHAPVLVLITSRSGPPDADAHVSVFLAGLRQLPAVEPIDLQGLSEPEVAMLIGDAAGRRAAARVRAETGGNPLLVREAVGRPGGRIGSLRALLARRYALLDGPDLAVLDLAAVVGPEFEADVLAAASDLPVSAVVDSLDRAETAGLVAGQPGRPGRFSFVHALFRVARYDDIPVGRRLELHRQVARALEDRSEVGELPDLARHASMAAPLVESRSGAAGAGSPGALADRARRSLRQSGDRAMALNDFAAAALNYQRALELWPKGDPGRPSLLLELGRALFTAERRGADLLGEARDGLVALGDDEGAAEAEMMLGVIDWTGSRWDDAELHFDRAATLVADRPPSRATAQVNAELARLRMIAGANEEAERYGAQALEMARILGLRVVEAESLMSMGTARFGDGDLGGIADIEAGVELAEAIGSPHAFRGYGNLSYVYSLLGDPGRARHWRRRAADAADRFGLADGVCWARAHTTEERFISGHWDEALADAEAFIADYEASAHHLVAVGLRVRASIRMGRGNPIGALADAAAALEFARGAQHPASLLVASPFVARCLYEMGRADHADAAVTESLMAAAGHENILEPVQSALVMAGLGRSDEFLAVATRVTIPSKRWEVGRLIAEGDLPQAADLLARSEQRSTEGFVRLVAAERLAADGSSREAEVQVRRALAFHRSVGASAYVARAERLVATLR